MSERNTTHDANESSTNQSRGATATRRSVLKAAAVGAAGLTVGAGAIGSGSAADIPIPPLTRCGNKLLDPTGQEVILNGTNIADPARQTRNWRGQDRDAEDTVALALDTSATAPSDTEVSDVEGWHNDIIRIPTQPQDILTGPDQGGTWDPWTLTPHGDDWGPVLPGENGATPAMTEDILDDYFTGVIDPLVDMCEEQGAYAMIDYHRHMPIFHQVQIDWASADYNCGDAVDSSTTFEHDNGGCGERGVLWHGADQVEEAKNLAPDFVLEHEDVDELFTEDSVAEALGEELEMYWNYVSEKYAERDHVVFDIYNEPTGPYVGDWGAPDRMPVSGGDETVDQDPRKNAKPWEMWVDRAQPWVDIVEENAPGSIVTIGSPRWSQYTYHAGTTSEFDFDELQMCYTAHIYMQENFDVAGNYGTEGCASEVPTFFSEFGWARDGGADEFDFLAGTTTGGDGDTLNDRSGKDRFEPFIENNPVHPLGWCFDHTWEPGFFDPEELSDGSTPGWMNHLRPYEDSTGQWWMRYAADHKDNKKPNAGSGMADCGDTGPTPQPPQGPQDPDEDGLYEDYNGDGSTNLADAGDLFKDRNTDQVQNNVDMYDFSGNGEIDLADVVQLFQENTA